MRAFRQVLQPAHARLRAAAARAEQLPSHRHDALPRRREKQFHRLVGRRRPEFRQRHGPNAAQIDDRRMTQNSREGSAQAHARLDRARVPRQAHRVARRAAGSARSSALQPGTSAEPSLSRMIRSMPAAALPNAASKTPACFPTKPRRPAGSAIPVKISRQPSPSAMSSQAHSHRRIGPFWYSRTWKRRWFSCHSPKSSSHRAGKDPSLPFTKRRTRP